MNGLFEENDWRDEAGALIGDTVGASILFFFHALVAPILTAWLYGGLVFYAVLGAYLLSLTVSSAAVSAAACLPTETQPAPWRSRAARLPRADRGSFDRPPPLRGSGGSG